jgi:LTXXQ motif family protein
MRKLGASFEIAVLTVVLFASLPASALGFRLGPLHFGLPSFWHRHHYHRPLYMRANPNEVARREQPQQSTPHDVTFALLYPSRALPAIFQNIFRPAHSSPWPFGYDGIFSTAFAQMPADHNSDRCRQAVDANALVERIRREIGPTPDQMERLQKLGGALGAAGDYLAKSCPDEISAQPTVRLQLMESQIEQLTMAIDIVRQPLRDLEQSLNSEQQDRLAGIAGTAAATDQHEGAAGTAIRPCGASLAAIDWPIDQIDNSIQPTEQQRAALGDVQQALGEAVGDLEAHCPTSVPQSAVARLETIEARLDATWRAILSIQVALANFESKLSDEQKHRFNTMSFATR